eukprot:Seg83.4 transcript_id=Seg83.4/GoldUCD/mRNA.D3Y31 product="putative protein K02A2.6" protein_id=Seg83.4/GoldUCD/D3Y31
MPKGPWQTLHLDFYGPLPTNEYLFVTIDSYSRYPKVEVVKSTSSNTVIPKLDSTFARHGLPYKIVTDNGPPFQSNEFSRYMQMLDIKHEPSTPYRTTPHSTTGVPPSQLLFNRKIRGKLPMLNKGSKTTNRHREAKVQNERHKEQSREYGNRRRNAKNSNIEVGDTVSVKQRKANKLTPKFKVNPYIVKAKKESRITAQNESHTISNSREHCTTRKSREHFAQIYKTAYAS